MDGREAMAKLVHVQRLTTTEDFFEHLFGVKKGETTNMANTVTNSKGETFQAGERVQGILNKSFKGRIVSIQAQIVQDKTGTTYSIDLDSLAHYEGPTDEDDAWERVTMDIGSVVHTIVNNGYQSHLYESDRRSIRHDAYVVLGSVMKVDEEVKARVRGIIERAERRFSNDRN